VFLVAVLAAGLLWAISPTRWAILRPPVATHPGPTIAPMPFLTPAPTGEILDGIELGPEMTDLTPALVTALTPVARQWLDRAHPGHPAIATSHWYAPVLRDKDGLVHPNLSSMWNGTAVLTLADGTRRATSVFCGTTTCGVSTGPLSTPEPYPS
jgi:hypothetical protein